MTRELMSKMALQSKDRMILHLRNQLAACKENLNEIENENRILHRMQRRMSLALNKYEGPNSDVSSVVDRHDEEMKLWHTKYLDMKKQLDDIKLKVKEKDLEILKLRFGNKSAPEDERVPEFCLQKENSTDRLKEKYLFLEREDRKLILQEENFNVKSKANEVQKKVAEQTPSVVESAKEVSKNHPQDQATRKDDYSRKEILKPESGKKSITKPDSTRTDTVKVDSGEKKIKNIVYETKGSWRLDSSRKEIDKTDVSKLDSSRKQIENIDSSRNNSSRNKNNRKGLTENKSLKNISTVNDKFNVDTPRKEKIGDGNVSSRDKSFRVNSARKYIK